jgi:hypothetical protein
MKSENSYELSSDFWNTNQTVYVNKPTSVAQFIASLKSLKTKFEVTF